MTERACAFPESFFLETHSTLTGDEVLPLLRVPRHVRHGRAVAIPEFTPRLLLLQVPHDAGPILRRGGHDVRHLLERLISTESNMFFEVNSRGSSHKAARDLYYKTHALPGVDQHSHPALRRPWGREQANYGGGYFKSRILQPGNRSSMDNEGPSPCLSDMTIGQAAGKIETHLGIPSNLRHLRRVPGLLHI